MPNDIEYSDHLPEWQQPEAIQLSHLRRRVTVLEEEMRDSRELRQDTGLLDASVEERKSVITVAKWWLRWHDQLDNLMAWWTRQSAQQASHARLLPLWVSVSALVVATCTVGTFVLLLIKNA